MTNMSHNSYAVYIVQIFKHGRLISENLYSERELKDTLFYINYSSSGLSWGDLPVKNVFGDECPGNIQVEISKQIAGNSMGFQLQKTINELPNNIGDIEIKVHKIEQRFNLG